MHQGHRLAHLRTKALVVLLLSTAATFAGLGACSGLKEGGDGADSAAPNVSTSPSDTSAPLPDGAQPDVRLPDGATPPTDATARDAQYQFDGGIVPRPTCVAGVSESWVPNAGCVPNAGPGACTFSKVSRTCKNGNCQKGYCQELDYVAETQSTPTYIYQVWGAAPDAVWAVGYGVWFWNGATWTSVDIGITLDNFTQAYAVAGTTRDDVTILTGNSNTGPMNLRRRVAGVWRSVGQINTSVWGGGLFALGNDKFLVHLGSRGAFLATPTAVSPLGLLYGFASGQHYTNALSGFKANDVLVASAGGQGTFYYDGAELKAYGPPAHAVLYVPDVIATLSSGSKISLFDPTNGTAIGGPVDLSSTLTSPVWSGLDGTSLDRIFACSTDGVLARRNAAGTWTPEPLPSVTTPQMNSVWASPWGDVYVAGSRVWHGQ